jgi:hypothetical protein
MTWFGANRGNASPALVENRELRLLWGVFFYAEDDLASPHDRIRSGAVRFFTFADAGAPFSLRLLCEAFFELELRAVQAMARTRIAQIEEVFKMVRDDAEFSTARA